METKNCIVCGKAATHWTCHIHTEIGKIITGWCDEHNDHRAIRPSSNKCTSSNPDSCKGDYKLSEIELVEELTKENLLEQIQYNEFSEMIDSSCSPYHPRNKRKRFFGLF